MQEIDVEELNLNPMTLIADGWMLLTAGTKETGYNTMTASWGQMGALWGNATGLPTTTVYVRPQRYTKEFIDREKYYTLSFFPREYRNALAYLGSHSGRNEDKIAKTGLTPVFGENATWFAEANLVMVCRKLYHAPLLQTGFVDPAIVEENYPERDFHEMYIGEIVQVLAAESWQNTDQ